MFGLFGKRPEIVIVCTANITRSPYFAQKLSLEISKLNLPKKVLPIITSSGVKASADIPAHPVMINVTREIEGVSLSGHLSTPFDKRLASKVDLVLTLEQKHKDSILEEFPNLQGKVFTIMAFARDDSFDGEVDISDPTGGEMEGYLEYIKIADAQAFRLRRYFKSNNGFDIK
jgi:protein arginine phosphatase